MSIPRARLACLITMGLSLGLISSPTLANNFTDRDYDGLITNFELAIGTNPDHPDSDGDTFTDLEELVGWSNALDPASTPDFATLSRYPVVYLSAPDRIRFTFWIAEPSGRPQDHSDEYLLVYDRKWNLHRRTPGVHSYEQPHPAPNHPFGVVFEIGFEAPRSMFDVAEDDNLGWHVLYSTNWGNLPSGEARVYNNVTNLRKVSKELVQLLYLPAAANSGGNLEPPRGTFRPLDTGSAVNNGWLANQICTVTLQQQNVYQQPETLLTYYQTAGAHCERIAGWFCPPDCGSVRWGPGQGELFRLLDPFAIVGQ